MYTYSPFHTGKWLIRGLATGMNVIFSYSSPDKVSQQDERDMQPTADCAIQGEKVHSNRDTAPSRMRRSSTILVDLFMSEIKKSTSILE